MASWAMRLGLGLSLMRDMELQAWAWAWGCRLPDLGPGLPGYQADHHLQDLQTWAWAWTAGLLGY
jgi:hypothetical protein